MDEVFTARRAARVLVLDGSGRVLLFHACDPARPDHRYWMTPGGGLDAGESAAVGAARELAEETGLRVTPAELGEPIWRDVTEFPFDGRWYRQEQEYFVMRAATCDVDTTGFTEVERGSIDAHRWWTLPELDQTDEVFYPGELPAVLRGLLGGAVPC
nr:NUDIX domain-containing protein [Micromonospora sp. DSM 115978]